MIPEDYVADLQLRLTLYRRLATLETDAEIDAFGAELIDRFGPLPDGGATSSSRSWRSRCCAGAPMSRRSRPARRASSSSFRDNAFANPDGLVAYVAEQGSFAKVRPDMRIVFIRDVEDLDERLKTTTGILRDLVRIAERRMAA